MHRRFLAVVAGVVASMTFSSVALANECMNASKQPEAGAQAILNLVTGEVTVLTEGLQRRIDQGLVDETTGEGFHGLFGFDGDGDGTAEFTTWIAGPDDHIDVRGDALCLFGRVAGAQHHASNNTSVRLE